MNLRGTWWLPGREAEKLHGQLTFTSDVQLLELDGSFAGPIQFFVNRFPAVIGITQNGDRITLLECVVSSTTMTISVGDFNAGHKSRLEPQFAVLGGHFAGSDAVVPTTLNFCFDGLASWIGRVGITLTFPGQGNLRLPVELSYDKLKLPSAKCESFDFSLDSSMNLSSDSLTFATIRETVSVNLKLHSGVKLSDALQNWLHPLQIFFSFALSQTCHPRDIILRTEETGTKELKLIGPSLRGKIEPIEESRILSEKMLLRLVDIEPDFQTVLEAWFRKYHQFEPVFSLYFGVISSREMFVDHRFLSLSQALEAYHRRFGDDLFVPPATYAPVYDALIAALPDGLPGDLRTSLKNRLKYGNEVSLRRRMRELLRKTQEYFPLEKGEVSQLINRVVDIRNHLTHQPDHDFSVDAKELFVLSNFLRHVLECCFLMELGLGEACIKGCMERSKVHRRFTFL